MLCPSCGAENPTRAKFCLECGVSLASTEPAREMRKTVTVLFCDVSGSTALGESTDPEAVRALLARYFERMRSIVESHGGAVEKFIGDAVMAVFGVPLLHEDDALRAIRAAAEMRDALPELGVQARIGVSTGEVVTGTAERLATGDSVNVAARLEQAAAAGDVLLGAATVRLARDAIEVEPLVPLALKGKADAVEAYRLLRLTGREATARRLEGVFVGREREQRLLREAFDLAVSGRACHLFTILGVAGVGKSRLAAEFLGGVDAAAVRGRCLSYGDGITYWPVVEVVKQLRPEERELDDRVARPLRALLGGGGAAGADEIAFAVRKLLEDAASEQPLVVVWDDLQWAEPTFLDLVEHVADWSRDAPILLLCLARPELLETRQGWGGGKLHATTVLVEPLGKDACEALLDQLGADLAPELRHRIIAAADGNPLFVEEMVAMALDAPDGDVPVPPTISALLSARLDQLGPGERTALERGSVEGTVFHRAAVEALDGDPAQLLPLVRKELVRPEKGMLPGDDAFRFRHILIRDAAYDALPKATRAVLHERFADWLERRAPDLVELDEIVGYHLEQAVRYRGELGALTDADRTVAAKAAERLQAAGERAFARHDVGASVKLLERAFALITPAAPEARTEWTLILALLESAELQRAIERADELAARGAAVGDRRTELYGRLGRAFVAFLRLPGAGLLDALRELALQARAEFEADGDELGIGLSWFALAHVHHHNCRWRERHEALEHARAHALRANDAYLQAETLIWMAASPVYGPMPAKQGLRWFDAHDPNDEVPWLMSRRAVLEAMVGNFERARDLIRAAEARYDELGQRLMLASLPMQSCEIALIADRPDEAAEEGIKGCRTLEALGERGWLSSLAGQTALALLALDRDDEAGHWIDVAEEAGAPDDVYTQALVHQVRARLASRQGAHEVAETLAREAVSIVDPTDTLAMRAEARLDLAEVLRAAGRGAEAARMLEEAANLFEQKGHLVGAARARELREEAASPQA